MRGVLDRRAGEGAAFSLGRAFSPAWVAHPPLWHSDDRPEGKGTPKNVIGRLNAAVVDALADPALQQRFDTIEQEIPPRDQQTPEALGALQQADIEKWWPIIKAANIKSE